MPYLYAEKTVAGTAPTVLFYIQLDAQPVAPTAWAQKNPFVPVIKRKTDAEFVASTLKKALQNPKDHYIFARASSDSKGPAFGLITALQLLHQKDISLPYNIKIIGDFQEELGSPTIPEFVAKNRELLAADAIVILDGTTLATVPISLHLPMAHVELPPFNLFTTGPIPTSTAANMEILFPIQFLKWAAY